MLSEKCQTLLEFLKRRAGDNPPSVREIGAECGIKSTSCVHRYLNILAEQGYIERTNNGSRCWRITGSAAKIVPIIGTITAGKPIFAFEEVTDNIPVRLNQEGDFFALRVKGESMKNAAILDGDTIVLKKQPKAKDGDIVAALIGEEATVKRFYKEKNGKVRLQPENDAFEPIYTDDCEILGVVVSVVRMYI